MMFMKDFLILPSTTATTSSSCSSNTPSPLSKATANDSASAPTRIKSTVVRTKPVNHSLPSSTCQSSMSSDDDDLLAQNHNENKPQSSLLDHHRISAAGSDCHYHHHHQHQLTSREPPFARTRLHQWHTNEEIFSILNKCSDLAALAAATPDSLVHLIENGCSSSLFASHLAAEWLSDEVRLFSFFNSFFY